MKTTKTKPQKLTTALQYPLFRSFSSPSSAAPPGTKTEKLNPYTYAKAIIEAVHQPIVILDKSLSIQSANKTFYKTFGLTKKQTHETSLLTKADDNPQIHELTKRLLALTKKNASFEEFEITYEFNKLGRRTLLLNAKRIHLGRYATDFILLGVEDITKRRMLDRQKDDFIGYVTHELKTPITAAFAFIQILQGYHSKTGDKKSQFLIAKVISQMDRLTGLLNSFTNVYKAQHGKLALAPQHFDLDKLVHEVVEAFQYSTTTHNLIIKGRISNTIFADKDRIHEVLINLIINAVKYSPQADKVIIKLSEDQKNVAVSIKDFGFGISKEEQKKVFERFFRVKGKAENRIEGLGLGLYLVSEIIKQHRGKIWVKSTFGQGSTFSFSLAKKLSLRN